MTHRNVRVATILAGIEGQLELLEDQASWIYATINRKDRTTVNDLCEAIKTARDAVEAARSLVPEPEEL